MNKIFLVVSMLTGGEVEYTGPVFVFEEEAECVGIAEEFNEIGKEDAELLQYADESPKILAECVEENPMTVVYPTPTTELKEDMEQVTDDDFIDDYATVPTPKPECFPAMKNSKAADKRSPWKC